MKIVFMGTPDIAAGILETLIESEHKIAAVVTQTDKPKGRGNEMTASPVKQLALKHGLRLMQPVKASDADFLDELEQIAPDAIIVAAYGQIVKRRLLDIPHYGCINVHASLLPKYRGAAPIQWAVINGEKETGITIMMMDEGIDTGDILLQEKLELTPDETAGSLFDRLTELAGPVLLKALERIEDGTIVRIRQDNEKATHVTMLKKSMGELDFTHSAVELERLIRGLSPWPSAYTFLEQKTLKLWKTSVLPEEKRYAGMMPGMVVTAGKDGILVKTGNGLLAIEELQLEGKKRMNVTEFLNGCRLSEGIVLGARNV